MKGKSTYTLRYTDEKKKILYTTNESTRIQNKSSEQKKKKTILFLQHFCTFNLAGVPGVGKVEHLFLKKANRSYQCTLLLRYISLVM